MINRFIKVICDELNIAVPVISYDTSGFATPTMLAYCDGRVIYIRHSDKPTPDQLYAIAHELRHLWQLQTNEDLYFGDYKKVTETDIESYNMQLAEIDANAFATVVMVDLFKIKPLYHGMSDKVVKRINDYIKTNLA